MCKVHTDYDRRSDEDDGSRGELIHTYARKLLCIDGPFTTGDAAVCKLYAVTRRGWLVVRG